LDNYFPGWKAKVNNVDTKIYRTNHTFRGIYVPSGENEIIFEYNPNSFRVGALVSLTSIILMSLFIFKIKKNE
ncbi:YfhO family protein, partial [Candidatus Curtissbacteria bacterium]|nr:YfhO family protein [Candidatus Curtissbacteria bacterium]